MPSPSPLSTLAASYSASVKSLEITRAKVEALFARSEMTETDVEQVYAGLFLNAFTEFEALIEDVFLGILENTHTSTKPTTTRRVEIVPVALTREILFEGKQYLDWLPLEKHTFKRAQRFLNNSEPFSLLTPQENKTLERLHLLRNAVAHKSDNAKTKFEASIQNLSLLPKEKTPMGFLRSKPQGPSGLNQYQIAVTELESMAVKLCN